MPFSATKIFLEETSLVARPIIPFPELKLRLEKRMEHLGIKVRRHRRKPACRGSPPRQSAQHGGSPPGQSAQHGGSAWYTQHPRR